MTTVKFRSIFHSGMFCRNVGCLVLWSGDPAAAQLPSGLYYCRHYHGYLYNDDHRHHYIHGYLSYLFWLFYAVVTTIHPFIQHPDGPLPNHPFIHNEETERTQVMIAQIKNGKLAQRAKASLPGPNCQTLFSGSKRGLRFPPPLSACVRACVRTCECV